MQGGRGVKIVIFVALQCKVTKNPRKTKDAWGKNFSRPPGGPEEQRTYELRTRLALDRCLAMRTDPKVMIAALSIQAMALHRQGQSLAARSAWRVPRRLIAEQLTTLAAPDWPDRLIARRLAREAQAVVRLDPVFPADPFAP